MSDALRKHPINDLFREHMKNCKQCREAAENRRMVLCFKGIRLLTGKPPPNAQGGAA